MLQQLTKYFACKLVCLRQKTKSNPRCFHNKPYAGEDLSRGLRVMQHMNTWVKFYVSVISTKKSCIFKQCHPKYQKIVGSMAKVPNSQLLDPRSRLMGLSQRTWFSRIWIRRNSWIRIKSSINQMDQINSNWIEPIECKA